MRTATIALAVWTGFVWVTRIRNAVDDDEGAGPIVLSAVFLALAAVALVLAVRGRGPVGAVIVPLAALTIVVWAVRGVDIALLSDHDAGFIAVHVGLGVVSIALSWWAISRLPGSSGSR